MDLSYLKGHWILRNYQKFQQKKWLLLTFRSVANYIGGVVLFTLAVFNTTLANVSLIQSLPLVAVFGFMFLGEKVTTRKVILVLLAFLGVILITVKGNLQITHIGIGELYAFAASISFAIGYIARRWHTKVLNNKEMTEIMLLIATVILFICSFAFREGIPTTGWTMSVVGIYLISGLFNTVALFLVNYGFEHVKAALASNLLTIEALFGVLLGFIFYREIPQIRDIAGGVLIIMSVLLFNKEEFK